MPEEEDNRPMIIPKLAQIDQTNTHRMIPSKKGNSVLTRIASNDDNLKNIFDLEGASNDRLVAENNLLPGISALELVYGFNYYHIVNASFCHAGPQGSRFNSSERGAWYASFDKETAQQEIIFHKVSALKELPSTEIDYLHDDVTYDNYLADFHHDFHDIRKDNKFKNCLDKNNYTASQKLASYLLTKEKSAGIIYPSVRHIIGSNLVCFRPALVGNVRKEGRYRFIWQGDEKPVIKKE